MEKLEKVPHNPQLNDLLAPLNLDLATLKRVMVKMAEAMDRGLSEDPRVAETSSLKMLPSYVCALPDGTENGEHLALDLGGTNFRVLVIKLEAERHAIQQSQIYAVPHDIMVGSGEKLFAHIADCLADFVVKHDLRKKQLPLGFTFSFPCEQTGLTQAKLITWTKGYKASGVEGRDVAQLLHEAIRRRMGGDIEVVAVLNDTVGTLMALAHEDPLCQIGVILGTGTNACYLEKAERSPKLRGYLQKAGFSEMIINMEWGAFGDRGELNDLRTEFDIAVDEKSINRGRQTFEKMISGMYIGEQVRLILLKLVEERVLFDEKACDAMKNANCITSQTVCEVVTSTAAAPGGGQSFERVKEMLKAIGIKDASSEDCANVAYVCVAVTKRSAELCGAGIATLLNRLQQPRVTVGIDGSVYRFNQPHFHDFLRSQINALLDFPCDFTIKLSTDGSGRGAALVAAVAARLVAEGKGAPTTPPKKDRSEFCDVM